MTSAPAGEGGEVYNSALLLDSHGRFTPAYNKALLVPFAEY